MPDHNSTNSHCGHPFELGSPLHVSSQCHHSYYKWLASDRFNGVNAEQNISIQKTDYGPREKYEELCRKEDPVSEAFMGLENIADIFDPGIVATAQQDQLKAACTKTYSGLKECSILNGAKTAGKKERMSRLGYCLPHCVSAPPILLPPSFWTQEHEFAPCFLFCRCRYGSDLQVAVADSGRLSNLQHGLQCI